MDGKRIIIANFQDSKDNQVKLLSTIQEPEISNSDGALAAEVSTCTCNKKLYGSELGCQECSTINNTNKSSSLL